MKRILFIALALFFASCSEQETQSNSNAEGQDISNLPKIAVEGKRLMEANCYTCHTPKAAEIEGRVAPPMVEVKAYYLKESNSKEDFIQKIKSFVENPTNERAKLKDALKNFGAMPIQMYPMDDIEKIAAFIYDYQIEEPSWFSEYWSKKENTPWKQSGKPLTSQSNTQKSLEDIGLEYALVTKEVLGKNLMGAIKNKGTLAALNFCNIQAIPLTDSMSNHYHASIKRVSDKNRNPNNKANEEELKYIAKFKEDVKAQNEIKPVVLEKENETQFYYPILTNSMCLQCHGTDIKEDVKAQILKLYPQDLAVGYKENEVRGIWSIRFNAK